MTSAATSTHETALLDELADMGMSLARRLHNAAHATTDLDLMARIGAAFHQVSRSVRQTLALKARFAAGWTPAQRAAVVATSTSLPTPTPDRAARQRSEAIRWNEYERLDCDDPIDDLDRVANAPENEPIDVERFEKALEAGVARLHRGMQALRPPPRPAIGAPPRRPNGAAARQAVNSS